MSDPTYVLLYVADAVASAAFYTRILGREPVELSPGFALFVLGTGMKLGLWTVAGVSPATDVRPGATELAFAVDDANAVDAMHVDWQGRGVAILQQPTDLDFGRAFLAADPDGHRLRVFTPNQGA